MRKYWSYCCSPFNHIRQLALLLSMGSVLLPTGSVQADAGCNRSPLLQPFQSQLGSGQQHLQFDNGTVHHSGWSTCSGNVGIDTHRESIRAEKLDFFRNSTGRIVCIRLHPTATLQTDTLWLEAETGLIEPREKKFRLQHLRYQLVTHAGGGTAAVAVRNQDRVTLTHARYSTCPSENPSWYLTAKQVVFDKRQQYGEARDATLYIQKFPVLYSPYWRFPLGDDPQSGLLTPLYHQDPAHGQIAVFPLYWRNTHWDTTWSPFFSQRRGYGLSQEWRYASRQIVQETQIGILPIDRVFAQYKLQQLQHPLFADPRDPRRKALARASAHRWGLSHFYAWQASHHWSGYWAYQHFSDEDLGEDYPALFKLMDLHTPDQKGSWVTPRRISMPDRSYLVRQARIEYTDPFTLFSARIDTPRALYRSNRPLLSTPYHTAPAISWQQQWLQSPVQASTRVEWTRFTHAPDPFTQIRPTTGQRIHLQPRLQWPVSLGFVRLEARARLHHRSYYLQDNIPNTPNKQVHVAIPVFQLESGNQWEKHWQSQQTQHNSQSVLQTLEPSLFVHYIPYRTQSTLPNFDASPLGWDFGALARANRYSGADRIGDTQNIAWRLRTRFIDAQTGEEHASLGIGQMYFRRTPRMELPGEWPVYGHRSPLLTQMRYQWPPQWSMLLENAYDLREKTAAQTRAVVDFSHEKGLQIQWEYLFLRVPPHLTLPQQVSDAPLTHQWSSAIAIPLNRTLSVWGFWRYDAVQHHTLERFAGVGYESCCWGVRLGLQEERIPTLRGKPYIHRFFAHFVLSDFASGDMGFHEYLRGRIRNWSDPFGKVRS